MSTARSTVLPSLAPPAVAHPLGAAALEDQMSPARSSEFRARIRALAEARRNATVGMNLVKTAEGALTAVAEVLTRMRDLSARAVSTTERGLVAHEFAQLRSALDRIVANARFHGAALLQHEHDEPLDIEVAGEGTGDERVTVSLPAADARALGLGNSSLDSAAEAEAARAALNDAIEGVSERRAALGAVGSRLSLAMSNLDSHATNLTAATARVVDVDLAEQTTRRGNARPTTPTTLHHHGPQGHR